MNLKRLLLALPLLFSSCHGRDESDENSPFFVIPAGSRLVLHQAVTVPAFSAGAYLQGGSWIPWNQISRYHPYCKLELQQPMDSVQTVEPDEFVITRAREELETQEGLEIRARVLELSSGRQPHVHLLSCAIWQSPSGGQPVSGRELRQALGGIFTLELPGRAPSSKPPA
ncbi:MAG: hypothetical protein OEM83_07900 [Gammaproteobacteria bacterium]|nr:hypothetical protein [Gammaproteobacteria bacterium]MDH5512072.1 hypothetical protein [Gammaproteobacteria bacterium]